MVIRVPQREALQDALDRLAEPGFRIARAGLALAQRALDAAAFVELGLQAVLQLVQLGVTLYELLRQVGLRHVHPTRGRIGRVGRRFRRHALHHVGLAKYSTGR